MNHQISPAKPASSIIRKITSVSALVLAGFLLYFGDLSHADAQFSKPVVVLKGTIHSEESGKAHSVKVSIRSGENKNLEVTSSRSNSQSGVYLVILEPKRKYWVRLEGPGVIAKEEMIETPSASSNTVQMNKDFTITTTSIR